MPKFTAAASCAHIPSSFLNVDPVTASEPVTRISSSLAHCVTAYSQDTSTHSQPEALGRSKRKSIPTKRALAGHIPEVARSKQRSRTYKRTLKLNKLQPSLCGPSLEHSTGIESQLNDDQTDSEPEVSTCDRTTKPLTPISTSAKQGAQQISDRQQIESQIFRKFRQILQDSETQDLEGVLSDLSNNSTHPIRSEESDPEVRVLSPIPVAVGGGFHFDYHSTNYEEMNSLKLPPLSNQQRPPHRMPSRPLADPASPFIEQTEVANPTQPPIDDHMSDGGQTELEVTDQPMTEWGIPASSQSLGQWVPDQPRSPHPSLPRSTSARSNRSEPTQVEDQQEAQVEVQMEAQVEGQQEEIIDTEPPRQSNIRTSTRRAVPRSGPYQTRLNIVSIDSTRRPAQTTRATVGPIRPARGLTHGSSAPQSHPAQPAPALIPTMVPHSPPQHGLARNQSIQAPSLQSAPPPASQVQSDTDLLEDDEEERAILRAMATCTIALPKKRKPAMSDLDSQERHIVLVVRDLVLARSLQEGTFQTRGVYRRWFEESYAQVYNLVYNEEIVPASNEMCTVTINNMSTSRGHINDRERELVRRFYNFIDPTNDEQCQENINNYAILWPNAFPCKDPVNETGHYESNVIGAGIAAGYFHTPTALGIKYPKYFKSMEYPLVAFILCSLQCCIGEWGGGFFEKAPISARYMLSLYVCHLQGLKEAELKAPERMAELRAKWYKDSLNASGALRPPKSKKFVQRITRREDVRPDSPHRRRRPVPRNATPGPGPISESHPHALRVLKVDLLLRMEKEKAAQTEEY